MSSTPFMQLYVGDYLADTLDLSTEQHGAYLLLLMTMWRHDARLPNDPKKLARIARLSPAKFKAVWAEIERFFQVEGEFVTNRRLKKEHGKAQEKSEVRASAGSAGGKAKALKDNEARVANAMRMPQQGQKSEPDIDADADTRAPDRDPGLMEAVCIAAGRNLGDLNGNATRFGMSPAETDALRRWQGDLGLSAESIVAEIRHQASRMRGPPNSLTYFTPGLRELAARLSAPPLEPSKGPTHDQPREPSDRRAAAADDAFAERVSFAARNRSPTRPDFGFG